ncbi:hypothetical protein [Trichloromonas sp.]|uniref:hypothetical protein n=1 Tax=Trichloromonas sp. TaxID=3069249 RepID=UPI003D817D0F
MTPFREQLKSWHGRLDKCSPREKALLTLVVLVLLVVSVDFLAIAPQKARQKVQRDQVAAARTEIQLLEAEMAGAEAKVSADPDRENRERLRLLQGQLGELDQQLESLALELIAPREMPGMLEELLLRQEGLRLLRVENLPPVPLLAATSGEKVTGMEVETANVYRHGLQLEFTGSYRQILAYLQVIEGLGRQMFWSSLDLQVEEHPRVKVVLTVYTLSLKKEWIGV